MGNCSVDNPIPSTHSSQNRGEVCELRMTTYTVKDSKLQIFNFESNKLHRHTYHIANDCVVMREGNQKKQIRETQHYIAKEEDQSKSLFQVQKKHNYFKIVPFATENGETSTQRSLWLVVRSLPQKRHHLREKDILKLGGQKIKIREIVYEDHHVPHAVIDLSHVHTKKKVYNDVKYTEDQDESCSIQSMVSDSEYRCRFCLETGTNSNPLICPCKCSGSLRYVHLKCIRKWLDTRLNISHEEQCTIVKWTPLTCQICKVHFKYRVFLDNVKYYTLEIPKPVKPYLVLEAVGKTTQFSKIFLFVSFSRKKVATLGRVNSSDIKLRDLATSRHHANIFYDEIEKKFYLTDNDSKYGTSVYVKHNILVNPHQKHISFQIGPELFNFQAFRKQQPFHDFHEEERYLNVVEKGSEDVLSSESEEDEQQHEQFQDEISSQQEQNEAAQPQSTAKLQTKVSKVTSLPSNQSLQPISNPFQSFQ